MSADGGGARLRPALLNPCFWPEVRRGSERFAAELGQGLIARGHEPTLITSHRGWPSVAREDGLRVVRVWRPPQGRLLRRRFERYLTHVPLSYIALSLGRYDLANPLYASDGIAALAWRRRTGRPVVFSFMGIPARSYLVARRRRLAIMARISGEADAVVALSTVAANAFRRELGVEARVIPPGVDLEAFTPGGGRAEAPTVFCAADAGAPHKRVPLLIEALRRARRERPDLRLVLNRPRDPRLVRRLSGEDWIDLREVDDHARLLEAYREAWVTALASYGEAFGLVLVESLACGTPVVATRAGGIPEVLDGASEDEVGTVVDLDGDAPEALARAIVARLERPVDEAAAKACRTHASRFAVDRCVEAYVDLYREVIAGRCA